MQYIIVLPQSPLNSAQRAAAISRELYCITVPVAVQQPYQADGSVFGIIAHPDGVQHALVVDLAYVIPVHRLATLERLVSLFPELTDTERLTLQAYIFANKEFRFGDIVPSTVQVRDEAYMIADGWFPAEP